MYFILFLSSLVVFSAFAEPIPDYNNPYSPIFFDKSIYSWTEKMKMTIISPSWNTDRNLVDSIGGDDDHPIKIATSTHSLKPYKFTETGANTGIFTGEVILSGFIHDADGDGRIDTSPRTIGTGPNSGFLEVDRDSSITLSFEFADGVILTESVPVNWNIGTIKFLQELFFSNDSVNIRVIDVDMNLNPEALDHLPIRVSSDSDVAGILVDAVETSESSGSFVATISLSHNLSSSGNRLYALPGDKIFGKYDDNTLPKPYSKSANLEISAFANVDSSIPPIERLGQLPVFLSDNLGNPLESFSSNTQLQIVGTIKNNQDFNQPFVYFFQIKNANNTVESISWIKGELSPSYSMDVSQSWTPKISGEYQIETFVWDSIDGSIALSPIMSTLIIVE